MEDKLLVLKCKRGSRNALGHIYEKYKNDLLILAIAAMAFKSIAKSLGISANTAKSRYRYGLDKLRLILDEEVEK